MRIAHVRERHAPAGAPWRLAGRAGRRRRPVPMDRPRGRAPTRRGRAPELAHDAVLYRQPLTHARRPVRPAPAGRSPFASWSRGSSSRDDDDPAVLDAADLRFGPPVLRPPSVRDFYAFEGHVRTMWERRGGEIPETWYRLPVFYFSNVSELRGPDDPVWCPGRLGGARLRARGRRDHRHARDRPRRPSGRRRRSAATRSSTTGRRGTSSATRRRSASGRPRARTSPARSGRTS